MLFNNLPKRSPEYDNDMVDLIFGAFFEILKKVFDFIENLDLDFQRGKYTSETRKDIARLYLKNRPVFRLINELSIQSLSNKYLKFNLTKLNLNQTALLFHYLGKLNAILEYDNTSLSEILYYLTGYSKHQLRTLAIPFVYDMEKGIISASSDENNRYADSIAVRDLLKKIIDDIDSNLPNDIKFN